MRSTGKTSLTPRVLAAIKELGMEERRLQRRALKYLRRVERLLERSTALPGAEQVMDAIALLTIGPPSGAVSVKPRPIQPGRKHPPIDGASARTATLLSSSRTKESREKRDNGG